MRRSLVLLGFDFAGTVAMAESATATQLDLLKVQAEVTAARTSRINARHVYNDSIAQFGRAGGLTEVEYAQSQVAALSP